MPRIGQEPVTSERFWEVNSSYFPEDHRAGWLDRLIDIPVGLGVRGSYGHRAYGRDLCSVVAMVVFFFFVVITDLSLSLSLTLIYPSFPLVLRRNVLRSSVSARP